MAMRISRKYTVDDWKALTFKDEAEWGKAVEMFVDRLRTRYLEHIEALLERPTSGFAVLSLDCVLIETLQQFHTGARKTPERKGAQYFSDFLTSGLFGNYFDKNSAKLFYETIRCGLLHQSEAEGNSRVKRGNGRPLVAYTDDHKGVIVNVTSFHELVSNTIDAYTQELRKPRSELRKAFRTKMTFICRVESKDAEDVNANGDTSAQKPENREVAAESS